MGRTTLLSLAIVFVVSAAVANTRLPLAGNAISQSQRELSDQERAIKITIATVDPIMGLPTNRYRSGEQVPITITMTNTTPQPLYACVSSDFYQDLPKLTRDGEVLPFMTSQSSDLKNAQEEQTCQRENLPEERLLESNQPTVADWLILVEDSTLPIGAMSWYDSLAPGRYELSIQRRFGCCDGPMVESNRISFEVVP